MPSQAVTLFHRPHSLNRSVLSVVSRKPFNFQKKEGDAQAEDLTEIFKDRKNTVSWRVAGGGGGGDGGGSHYH